MPKAFGRLEDIKSRDLEFLRRAVEIAHAAESRGNMPIGALLVLEDRVIAEGENALLIPEYRPGNHAEMIALAQVPAALWPEARAMTCYTTLEPCVMCTGALLLHGVGRVVFGAIDVEGGGHHMLAHLPPYYKGGAGTPTWLGPGLPEICDPLYHRADRRFRALPCGTG